MIFFGKSRRKFLIQNCQETIERDVIRRNTFMALYLPQNVGRCQIEFETGRPRVSILFTVCRSYRIICTCLEVKENSVL